MNFNVELSCRGESSGGKVPNKLFMFKYNEIWPH